MEPLLVDVPERLLTPRLLLRAPRPGDGSALCRAVTDSLPALQPWLPWAQQAPTAADSEANVRRMHARFMAREDLVFQIWDRDETCLVGGTGLHRIDWSVPRFEIGYWRASGCEGRGYVTEAVTALARMAFDVLGAQRVEVRMDEANAASRRVAERAGFPFEALLRCDARTVDGRVRNTCVYARVRGVEEVG